MQEKGTAKSERSHKGAQHKDITKALGPDINLPERVILCGIGYRVQEREGIVIFTEESGFYGTYTRIVFERTSTGDWYVSLFETWGRVMVDHIIKAYEIICKAMEPA